MTATVSSTPSKPSKQAVATLRHISPGWIGRIIAALATAAVLAYPLSQRQPLLPEHDHPLAGLRDRRKRSEHHHGLRRVRLARPGRVHRPGWLHRSACWPPSSTRCRRGCGCRWPAWSPRPVAVVLGLVSLRSRGPVVRDHHRRVPVPRATGDRGQLAVAHRRHGRALLPLPTWGLDIDQLAVLLRARGDPGASSC